MTLLDILLIVSVIVLVLIVISLLRRKSNCGCSHRGGSAAKTGT